MNSQDNFFQKEHIGSDLKRKIVHGGAVTVTAQACLFSLKIGSTMILARMLTPTDFGLIAMVSVVTGFVTLFKDLGLSAATVQRENIDHALVSNLFWLNVAFSFGIMLLFVAIAPGIAWFYGEPRIRWIMFALSGAFLLGGLTVQHQALLRRHMRFTTLATLEITAGVSGMSTAVVSAWFGAGYWSLVLMHLVTGVVMVLGVWSTVRWYPSPPAAWHTDIRAMLAFGGNLTGFNVINYFARNLDQLLIGWYWGAQSVGVYSKAYQLLLLPVHQINNPLSKVAVPALSRLQHDSLRYRRYYCWAMTAISFLTMPLTLGMAVLSDEIIMVVLGSQWIEVGSIFRVLAIAAFGQPLANATGWIFLSLGQTKRMLQWSLIGTPPLILAFFIGLPWGPLGVATAYAIVAHIRRWPLFIFAFKDSPISLKDLMRAIWRPSVVSLLMAVVMMRVHFYVSARDPALIILFCCSAAVCTLTASILGWPGARRDAMSLVEITKILKGHRKGKSKSQTGYETRREQAPNAI